MDNINLKSNTPKNVINVTSDSTVYYANVAKEAANSATQSAQLATEKAQIVQNGAQTALNAINELKTSSLSSIETLADSSTSDITELKNSSVSAINELKTNSLSSIETLADSSTSDITALKNSSVSAINELKTTSLSSIETLADSSTSDITALKNSSVSEINELKTNSLSSIETLADSSTTDINTLKTSSITEMTSAKTTALESITQAETGALASIESASLNFPDRDLSNITDDGKDVIRALASEGGSSSSGGGGSWGSITGTLSEQTDLVTALANKLDVNYSNSSIPYVTETGYNGFYRYRKWSDGYLEQMGLIMINENSTSGVFFPFPYRSINYSCIVGANYQDEPYISETEEGLRGYSVWTSGKEVGQCYVSNSGPAATLNWYAFGRAATS